ncbi:hypothetical protein OAB00_02880 [Akkermansiaceae bacterium]|nr:hypothetical protein [Akkermansiaceae bacterium]
MSSDSEISSGNYLCSACNTFFTAPISNNVSCSHCHSSQLSINAWEQTILKRKQDLPFEETISEEQYKVVPDGESQISQKLDYFGQKKRRRKHIMALFVLCWVVGLAVLGYNHYKPKTNTLVTAQDGSVTQLPAKPKKPIINPIQKFGQVWVNTYNHFMSAFSDNQKAAVLYNWTASELSEARSLYNYSFPPNFFGLKKAVLHDDFAEVSAVSNNQIEFLIIYKKEENGWLIDFDHFINRGTMDFSRFLEEQTKTPQTFRLYVTEHKSGLTQLLTLQAARPNDQNYVRQRAAKTTITIDKNESITQDLELFIKAWKSFKKFNSTLPSWDNSAMGDQDPSNAFRGTLTLQHEEINGQTVLKIKKIHSAHWLGDYYKDFLTPAQKITLPIMYPQ